jgi:transcriptional regulator with XRE-family HTH domain
MSSIGNRIKELLNKHDISQKDLARYIGTSEASISRYVNDEREPVAKILYKIAQELHTTTDYLISGVGDNYEELYWMEFDRANSYARKLEHTKQFNEYYKNQNKVLEKALELACDKVRDNLEWFYDFKTDKTYYATEFEKAYKYIAGKEVNNAI